MAGGCRPPLRTVAAHARRLQLLPGRTARERARRGLGDVTYRRIADRLDFYIGVAEDRCTVLTVAHRLQRRKSA